MCGICGWVMPDPSTPTSSPPLHAMMDEIEHRGPDAEGSFVGQGVALGHRRLSIVDVSSGRQPMTNEDGTVTVIFNGEIYNHESIRTRLEGSGHQYRTHSDTEAIVHLYEEVGEAVSEQLRGMFAFALWDSRRRTLVLSRDHLGVKPLYYATRPDGTLVFASEIKCIMASGLVTPMLDTNVIEEYFATGHVSGDRTLLIGVRKLQPGHTLKWQNGRIDIHEYWRVGMGAGQVAASYHGTPKAALKHFADQFWERFLASVQSQLMADVPLGVFLSGGLDSSLLVAAMKESGVDRIQSFSVGYLEASDSELPWARAVADAMGTEHRETLVDGQMFFDDLGHLTSTRDLPLTFSASIPLYRVARLAKEHVKVVLTGEGSDELFAGYGRYPRALLNLRWAKRLDAVVPAFARNDVAARLRSVDRGYFGSRLARSFLAASGTVDETYLEAFADFNQTARASLLNADVPRGRPFGDVSALVPSTLLEAHPLEALLQYDQRTYLEELLMKQDAMSMAASIESRVPFLDHYLTEWAATLPQEVKLAGMKGKALVRAAASGRIPQSAIDGSKRGFTVPLAAWLRGVGRATFEECLPQKDDALLNLDYVRLLKKEHDRGADHTAKLWRVVAFQTWRHRVLPRLVKLAADNQLHN